MLATTLTSCEIAGGLVKGGIWIGVIGVFAVVAVIFWLVTKMGGGSNNNTGVQLGAAPFLVCWLALTRHCAWWA
jgi:hypothetical protein